MEENKEKEVKLSYEELEKKVAELEELVRAHQSLNGELSNRLMNSDLQNMFKRLDFLFKVIELEHSFTGSFVDDCVAEVEQLLAIPKQEPKEDKE